MEGEMIFVSLNYLLIDCFFKELTHDTSEEYPNNYPQKSTHITDNENINNSHHSQILHSLTQSSHYNSHNNNL